LTEMQHVFNVGAHAPRFSPRAQTQYQSDMIVQQRRCRSSFGWTIK